MRLALALLSLTFAAPAQEVAEARLLVQQAQKDLAAGHAESAARNLLLARDYANDMKDAAARGEILLAIETLLPKADPLAKRADELALRSAKRMLKVAERYSRRGWGASAWEVVSDVQRVEWELSGTQREHKVTKLREFGSAFFASAQAASKPAWKQNADGSFRSPAQESRLIAFPEVPANVRIEFDVDIDRAKGIGGLIFGYRSADDFHAMWIDCRKGASEAAMRVRRYASGWDTIHDMWFTDIASIGKGWIECVVELRGNEIAFRCGADRWFLVECRTADISGRIGFYVPGSGDPKHAMFRLKRIARLPDADSIKLDPVDLYALGKAARGEARREAAASIMRVADLATATATVPRGLQATILKDLKRVDPLAGQRALAAKSVGSDLCGLARLYEKAGWKRRARRLLELGRSLHNDVRKRSQKLAATLVATPARKPPDRTEELFRKRREATEYRGWRVEGGVLVSPRAVPDEDSAKDSIILSDRVLPARFCISFEMKVGKNSGGLVFGYSRKKGGEPNFLHVWISRAGKRSDVQIVQDRGDPWTKLLAVEAWERSEPEPAWLPVELRSDGQELRLSVGGFPVYYADVDEVQPSGAFGFRLGRLADDEEPVRFRKIRLQEGPANAKSQ